MLYEFSLHRKDLRHAGITRNVVKSFLIRVGCYKPLQGDHKSASFRFELPDGNSEAYEQELRRQLDAKKQRMGFYYEMTRVGNEKI